MGQLLVRNLAEAVIRRLKARARARGVSLEQELREILTAAAKPSREEALSEMERVSAMSPALPPDAPRSEAMIREDRDRR
jgi:plasmid stability protein